jgi:hypothetical protein
MLCANAASTIWFAKFVRSAAQSLKAERKPCTVTSPRPRRASTLDIAAGPRPAPRREPIKTRGLLSSRGSACSSATAVPGNGTRCSFFDFIRAPGTAPGRGLQADLTPLRTRGLAAPGRRQDDELQRASGAPLAVAQLGHEGRQLSVRQRGVVLDPRRPPLLGQHPIQMVSG